MNLKIKYDCLNVDWNCVRNILKEVGMGYHSADKHKIAFENSYSKVFIYDKDNIIGFGRVISDGVYQAAIYDVAVLPRYQGKGIGKMIVDNIVNTVSQCNIILYASPGKEEFYKKHNFRIMKTGMAIFSNAEKMKERGFVE